MDFEQISRSLLPLLGGKENIASAAHCATRLRLVLVDDALADQQAIGKIDGVKGCFRNAGQMQIIFGTGVVNKVYAAFIQAAGISESSKSEAADLAAKKLNPFQRIARLLSNIFVPIIPAIVASGLLMGLLGMVKTYGWVDPSNALYIMLDMCSSAAFIILPILIGFTAAREFGGNPYLGATLGGILTHPALTNAWGVAAGFHTMNFFGIEVAMIGYQGTVFPVLLAVLSVAGIRMTTARGDSDTSTFTMPVYNAGLSQEVADLQTALIESQTRLTSDDPWDHVCAYALGGGSHFGMLYAVPDGMGLQFDEDTYLLDPANEIHSRYVMANTDSDVAQYLEENGWALLYEGTYAAVYECG